MAKTKSTGKRITKPLNTIQTKAIEKIEGEIERARSAAVESKQPRFAIDRKSINTFFDQIYGVAKEAIFNEPPIAADSSRRDTWLARVVKKEPYLDGILQSVVSIDKNRGWTLVGGKIQVKKFVNILHGFSVAPDLYGWRNGLSVTSQNFYQADLGGVVEVGRSMVNGPLAALYTVDPTKCHLTGKVETPLRYNNGRADKQFWEPTDYFRVASFPSPSESMNGLGYCAISRCLELAKLLVSVFEHDREQLGSKAPKGILIINGVPQDQWLQSLEESTSDLKTLQREYYSGVQVLANDMGKIEVELVSLSNLPTQFDHRQFTDMIIYGYALAFGYDPREFWPVSGGSLGTGRETESQHRKASSKGGLDFALGFQEKLQEELPETLNFEFEQRDVEGDIFEVELKQKQLTLIDDMYKSVNAKNETMITYGEARELLVNAKLIPDTWTPAEEEVLVTDTEDMGEVIEQQRVRNAMDKFPDEDIVIYESNTNRMRTIRKAGQRKFSVRVTHTLPESKKKDDGMIKVRAYDGDFSSIRDQYYEATYTVVRDYLKSSDRATSYKSAMSRNVVEAFGPAAEQGYRDGGSEPPLEDDVNDWLTAAQSSELANVGSLFVSLKMLRDGSEEGELDADSEAEARASGYASTLDYIYNTAVLYGSGNKMLTFTGSDGTESCSSCKSLKGQRHKASWWIAHDSVPPSGSNLECSAGGKCEHILEDDNGVQVTV